ncbi:MAG: hypothetical protein HFG41_06280 [Coprococcus sp.]|nr:hypothetical protein [Coprococcus sp.]
MKNSGEKRYTAQEIIDVINEGWTTVEELKKLYEFVERAQMENGEELDKLRESDCAGMLYNEYDIMVNL